MPQSISRSLCFGVVLALNVWAAPAVAPAAVLIEIDGKPFTAADVQAKNGSAVFQARNALFEAERKAADDFINDYLLDRQAKKENLTVEQLLEKHAYSALAKPPSEEALRIYYEGIDVNESFDAVRDKIIDVLRQRRMNKARTAYIQSLRSQAAVTVRLAAPRASVSIGDAPTRGASGAPVTIIEYADYECPYCQQINPVVDRVEKEYKGKINFAFKDVPLPMHANAQKAAEAAHCAGTQGKFWEYHDRLFSTKELALPQLKGHAQALSLDQAAFDRCLDSGAQADRIKAHVSEAQSIGLPGTPGFFVNGRFLSGAIDYQTLRRVIDEELRAGGGSGTETAQARD